MSAVDLLDFVECEVHNRDTGEELQIRHANSTNSQNEPASLKVIYRFDGGYFSRHPNCRYRKPVGAGKA